MQCDSLLPEKCSSLKKKIFEKIVKGPHFCSYLPLRNCIGKPLDLVTLPRNISECCEIRSHQ